jgi:hypothetical protein
MWCEIFECQPLTSGFQACNFIGFIVFLRMCVVMFKILLSRSLYRSLLFLLLVGLTGCSLLPGGRVNQEHYEKIYVGMELKGLKEIMGEPQDMQSIGVNQFQGRLLTWKDGDRQITVTLLNDAVMFKGAFGL